MKWISQLFAGDPNDFLVNAEARSGSSNKQVKISNRVLNRRATSRFEKGVTLTEILVVIAIVMVLAAIFAVAQFQAKRDGLSSACQSNLKQMATAVSAYMGDSDETYPPSGEKFYKTVCGSSPMGAEMKARCESLTEIENTLKAYVKSSEVYHCRLDTGIDVLELMGLPLVQRPTCFASTGSSYWYNEQLFLDGLTASTVQKPSESLLSSDRSGKWRNSMPGIPFRSESSSQEFNAYRGYIYNILFCDGHVTTGSPRKLNEAKGKSFGAAQWIVSNFP